MKNPNIKSWQNYDIKGRELALARFHKELKIETPFTILVRLQSNAAWVGPQANQGDCEMGGTKLAISPKGGGI